MRKLLIGLVIVLGLVACISIINNIVNAGDILRETLMETAEYASAESYDEDAMMDVINNDIDEMATLLNELKESGELSDEEIMEIDIALKFYNDYVME